MPPKVIKTDKKDPIYYKLCKHPKVSTDEWSFRWCQTCGAIKFWENKESKFSWWKLPEWRHKF